LGRTAGFDGREALPLDGAGHGPRERASQIRGKYVRLEIAPQRELRHGLMRRFERALKVGWNFHQPIEVVRIAPRATEVPHELEAPRHFPGRLRRIADHDLVAL